MARTLNLITIGATVLPTPSSYAVSVQDIDSESSGRDEAGAMHREVITTKYKIQASWHVKSSDLKTITTALSAASFSVTFVDPTAALQSHTATMYAGDKSADMVLYNADNDIWWDLTANLIEV